MAIFHLSVKTVSRSTGRSAVAAAAYRSGDTLTNERDGRQHNYVNRTGIDDSFIIAPAGCEWTHDRSTLWNAAEQAEKRSNSVTAREYVLALPAELDAKDRADLARSFASAVVERYGVAADVAIHAPSAGGDDRNYHAHILTTTREVEPDGLGKKTRILDAAKTGGPEIESLRELWAMQCNEALERHQKAARIDHRSYERQGVDEIPTMHLGPTSTTMERKHKAEQERKGEPYKPQTFKARENERRRTLNESVRKLVQDLEKTIKEKAEREKRRIEQDRLLKVVDWYHSEINRRNRIKFKSGDAWINEQNRLMNGNPVAGAEALVRELPAYRQRLRVIEEKKAEIKRVEDEIERAESAIRRSENEIQEWHEEAGFFARIMPPEDIKKSRKNIVERRESIAKKTSFLAILKAALSEMMSALKSFVFGECQKPEIHAKLRLRGIAADYTVRRVQEWREEQRRDVEEQSRQWRLEQEEKARIEEMNKAKEERAQYIKDCVDFLLRWPENERLKRFQTFAPSLYADESARKYVLGRIRSSEDNIAKDSSDITHSVSIGKMEHDHDDDCEDSGPFLGM